MAPQTEQTDVYDIVVIGAGPAGLMAGTNLVRWGYKVLIIDDRPEATTAGRADGLHPRTVEVLANMGFEGAMRKHEPGICRILNFWITASDKLTRMASLPACPPSVDTRYPHTMNLHQGLIEGLFIDDLAKHGVTVDRPRAFKSFDVDQTLDSDYPVTVHMQSGNDSSERSVYTRYLLSGEGAHSITRKQLGIQTEWKEGAASTYGVVDGEVDTDFPDIREACVLQGPVGSLLLIPRERNNLVRIYVPYEDMEGMADARGCPSLEHIQDQARRIFHPYSIKWDNTEWVSSYSVRQGIAESYGRGRIFLLGDACHVHSPKMGQGMNLAFADAVNLSWKIHAVESGIASPKLLDTYELERRQAAQDVIEFDYHYAAIFAQRLMGVVEKRARGLDSTVEETNGLAAAFAKSGVLISGYGVSYAENLLNWSATVSDAPPLDLGSSSLKPGSCFALTADVTRVHDGKVVQLEQEIGLDGTFRIYIFAGDLQRSRRALDQLSAELQKPESFLNLRQRRKLRSANAHQGSDSKWFTLSMTFIPSCADSTYDIAMPAGLGVGSERIYADDQGGILKGGLIPSIAHTKAGLKGGAGAVVVVRPDGYVAMATQLVDSSAPGQVLNSYFSRLRD